MTWFNLLIVVLMVAAVALLFRIEHTLRFTLQEIGRLRAEVRAGLGVEIGDGWIAPGAISEIRDDLRRLRSDQGRYRSGA